MEWISLLAILVSPLLAVQVTEYLRSRRDMRDRRLYVFRTLMATRAAGLDPQHVAALNMIDVEFYGSDRNSRAVLEACRLYLEHHNRSTVTSDTWSEKREELLIDLLQKMGASLGYEMDKVSIRNTSYFPRGYGDYQYEWQLVRKYLVALLEGKRWIPVFATTPTDFQQGQMPHAPQSTLDPGPPPESQRPVDGSPPVPTLPKGGG
jgi:hypothetical protein